MLSPHVSAPLAVVALCGSVVAGAATPVAAPTEKRTFNLPRGDAAVTLKQFAACAGTPIVYLVDRVRGATTHAVSGEFTPREALDRMLAGSALEAAQDAATGALVVSRKRTAEVTPNQGEVGPASDPQPKPPVNPMKSTRTLLAVLATWLNVGPATYAQTATASTKDKTVTLSPFEVRTDRDVGFVAASSLAGGRLASDLVDTPVAYSVQTREFLDALNIGDLNEAINWTVNATTTPDDGGGQLFGGTGSTTIRGVGSNATNRNFFVGGSNPSTYNLERMDYARGPNSILFGTGTLGGTANLVVKSARIGRNSTEVRAEYSSWKSYNTTIDANYSINKKVASRVVATWQDSSTWRDWERRQRKGVSPSVTFDVTPKTRLSIIGDWYEQKAIGGMNALNEALAGWDGRTVYSGIQPATLPSQTAFGASRVGTNNWVVSPASGYGFDTAYSYTGMMQTIAFSGNRPLNGATAAATTAIGLGTILDQPHIYPGLFDAALQGSAFRIPARSFTNLGPNPTSINRFRDATFFLDQKVTEAISLQLSGAINRLNTYGLIDYFSNNNYPNTYIDINRLLPDGKTNPNFLQPYNEFSRAERQKVQTENKALRLAAAYVKEHRWFRLQANVIGAWEGQDRFVGREYFMIPYDADPRAWGLISSTRTQTLRYRYYWNQPQRKIEEMKQITLVDPSAGTTVTYQPRWVLASDRNDATVKNITRTKCYQGSANVSLWQKRIVLLGAFRTDQIDRNQRLFLRPLDHPSDFGPILLDRFRWRPDAPADYFKLAYIPKDTNGNPAGNLQPAPASRPRNAATGVGLPQYARDRFQDDFNPLPTSDKKTTHSVGGILNLGRGFSLWANSSQTFNPADFTKTTIDYGTPPPSSSSGTDFGIRYSAGPRFYATLSRYRSQETDAVSGAPAGSTWLQPIISTNALGDLESGGRNIRSLADLPTSWADVMDRKTNGYELEIVANPTRNWRLTANYGLAYAIQTDAYRQSRAWIGANEAVLRQILDDAGIQISSAGVASAKPGVTTAESPDLINGTTAWNNLRAGRANWISGDQTLNRLTKYTANFFSDYRFADGRLRGLRFGYGMQFRGPQAIGYRGADTIVNPANPATAIDDPNVGPTTVVWQKAHYLATTTLGYALKVGGKKIDFNLTVANLFNYDKPLYNGSALSPTNADITTPARTTIPRSFSYVVPRSFRLSATHTF
jgi:outer membrane receptor protein involved in Fe transport